MNTQQTTNIETPYTITITINYSQDQKEPQMPGMNPVYCPCGSGNASLIFHMQQLGITLLFPAPRDPCCQKMKCLYAA